MKYICIFMLCFLGSFLLRAGYLQLCKKENFIYYTLVCSLIDKRGLQVKDKSGECLSKRELYQRMEIYNSFAEKIWFESEE